MASWSENCKKYTANLLENLYHTRNVLDSKEDQAIVLAKTVKELQKVPGLGKKINSLFTNSLISSVGTHLANIASVTRLVGDTSAKWVQGGMYDLMRAIGTENLKKSLQYAPGIAEAKGFTKGLGKAAGIGVEMGPLKALSEFWHFTQRGFMTGLPSDAISEYPTHTIGGGSVDKLGVFHESSKAEKIAGKIIETPSRVSVALDEGMKAYYRRVKAYELIEKVTHRYTDADIKALGQTRESILSHLTDALDNGDKDWLEKFRRVDPKLTEEVINFAKKETFQQDPPMFIKRIMQYKDSHPWAGFFAPFIRTPWNIAAEGAEYLPGVGVAKHFTSKDDLGFRRFHAPDFSNEAVGETLAKQAIGLSSIMGLYAMHDAGLITTGYSNDPAERQKQKDANIPEFGIKVGDKWLNWSRVEPFATFAISALEAKQHVEKAHEDWKKNQHDPTVMERATKAGEAIAVGFSKGMVNRQFLYGISTALNAALAPDKKLEQFAEQFFGGITVPALVGSVARGMDPYQRKIEGVGEAIQSRIPGLRENLPIDYGTAGGPNRNPSYGSAAAFPFVHTNTDQTELQAFLGSLKNFKKGPVGDTLKGVKLDQRQAELLDKLSSEEAGKYLERTFRSIRDNPNMTDAKKAYLAERQVDKARTAAQHKLFAQLIKEPEFRQKYLYAKAMSKGNQ